MAEASLSLNIHNLSQSNSYIENQMTDLMMDLTDINRQALQFTQDKNQALKNVEAMYGKDSSAYEHYSEEINDDFDYKTALVEDVEMQINTEKSILEAQHKANDTLIEGFKAQRKENIAKDFGYFKHK